MVKATQDKGAQDAIVAAATAPDAEHDDVVGQMMVRTRKSGATLKEVLPSTYCGEASTEFIENTTMVLSENGKQQLSYVEYCFDHLRYEGDWHSCRILVKYNGRFVAMPVGSAGGGVHRSLETALDAVAKEVRLLAERQYMTLPVAMPASSKDEYQRY